MKVIVDRFCGVFRYHGAKLVIARLTDCLDAFEMLQKGGAARFTHAGDSVQHRSAHTFAVAFSVKGDGKAVGLLLDPSDQGEYRLIVLYADLPPLRGDEGAGAVAVVLDHAEDGNSQPKMLRDPAGDPCVLLTAVDQKNVGQGHEFLVLLHVVGKAAGEDFFHGTVVVGMPRKLLDAEAAVALLGGA